jgi:predicted glycogen debranching enzyme
MDLNFGREICNNLAIAETKEWLVTNGIGGFASGTISGMLTRRYHGLLIAALTPPTKRTLLLAKLDETVRYIDRSLPLFTNRWQDEKIEPEGYLNIEQFYLDGTIPVWKFACGDALIEKRIWMPIGANRTYISYRLLRATAPINLSIEAFINYRDYHSNTNYSDWLPQVKSVDNGICVTAFNGAVPFYLLAKNSHICLQRNWYINFYLAAERERGLNPYDNHFQAATFNAILQVGETFTIVAGTKKDPQLDGSIALESRRQHDQQLLERWYASLDSTPKNPPPWIEKLVLAADRFIVNRPLLEVPDGKTIIAGYHWFGDWGRDTTISLEGLTLATGRPEVAKTIILTFSRYLSQGMLPNLFPDAGQKPEYNTVDAILWYFEAVRAYLQATKDRQLLEHLFPLLEETFDWHRRGTRYNIHLDSDGLIYAGKTGVQLTWMDAKVEDWVVTPRIGKPIEINALWYNASIVMQELARELGKSDGEYLKMAANTQQGFQRFWQPDVGYCYDVVDTPSGDDLSLRPNQIFAVSLPKGNAPTLLDRYQQKSVVDTVARSLLTSYGLRSLDDRDPRYRGQYGGNLKERDGAYHQGTVWAWLIGHFVQAHLKVYGNPTLARTFLEPMEQHLAAAGIGSISEIFDGDSPLRPKGCIAQAWSVAEVLRAWLLIENFPWDN